MTLKLLQKNDVKSILDYSPGIIPPPYGVIMNVLAFRKHHLMSHKTFKTQFQGRRNQSVTTNAVQESLSVEFCSKEHMLSVSLLLA